jgi:hypothetical protein
LSSIDRFVTLGRDSVKGSHVVSHQSWTPPPEHPAGDAMPRPAELDRTARERRKRADARRQRLVAVWLSELAQRSQDPRRLDRIGPASAPQSHR